jgi:neutral ceramidase
MAIMPSADAVAQSQRIDLERAFVPVQSSATSRKPTPRGVNTIVDHVAAESQTKRMKMLNLYQWMWKGLGLVALASLFTLAAEDSFQAGAARRDITPREPVPMWGYGARRDALSTGVADPLYASALVLEAGGRRLAIVGLDLGRGPTESMLGRLRERIRTEAGIDHAFFGGSHTHHGPVLELSDAEGKGRDKFGAALRYYEELEDELVAVVTEACRNLVPARLAVGSRELEGFNRNRHTRIEPKPVDRELAVLRVDDWSGRPIAVLVNFAAHPTSIPAENLELSADYPGALKGVVEAELGGVAVFMQGAGGDLSTDRGGHGDYRQYGAALGDEAARLAASLTPERVGKPALRFREEQFEFASRTNFRNPLQVMMYALAFFPELIANYADEFADGIRPRLSVALLNGEIAFVGGSGEFFCQHAIRLKERARVRQLFFFGYCNGHHLYFPTIEAIAEGGYGADARVAPVAIGAGERLMDTALIWLYEMLGRL